MKFIDEAKIHVEAGKGGNGSSSFRREKFIPLGGPDGGDGGNGGSIFLQANSNLNTLVDFRNQPRYKAENGEDGHGGNCTGKTGSDLVIQVPVGTVAKELDTDEIIADLTENGQIACVAKGGEHGLGNTHFKSSTNRAPRRTIPGKPGEKRELLLELKVLADVGLLGMPNAGKSTFITAVSSARPKVADYPFTTLHPNLGVVRVGVDQSFVIADIPGLIEGASEGTGLGIQFLKHLSRTKLLLHVIDIAPFDGSDPITTAQAIVKELEKYDTELGEKPRWLVLNKIDLFPQDEADKLCKEIVSKLKFKGPVFQISAITKTGTEKLCQKIAEYLYKKE